MYEKKFINAFYFNTNIVHAIYKNMWYFYERIMCIFAWDQT